VDWRSGGSVSEWSREVGGFAASWRARSRLRRSSGTCSSWRPTFQRGREAPAL